MNTTTRTSTAERLGRAFGRGWRAYARGERRASNWLVSKGMPRAGATALVWVAATIGNLREASIAGVVVGPGLARRAGAIAVVVATRVREKARADPGHVVHLLLIEIRALHEQFGPRGPVAIP